MGYNWRYFTGAGRKAPARTAPGAVPPGRADGAGHPRFFDIGVEEKAEILKCQNSERDLPGAKGEGRRDQAGWGEFRRRKKPVFLRLLRVFAANQLRFLG